MKRAAVRRDYGDHPQSRRYLEYDNVCLRTHDPTPLVLFHADGDEGG